MNTTTHNIEETKLANEIVSVLDPAALRACSENRDAIRYAVRGKSLKLRTIVLGREALSRLVNDPAREVKIEYLKREILRCSTLRSEYHYPRPTVVRTRPETAPVEEDRAAAI